VPANGCCATAGSCGAALRPDAGLGAFALLAVDTEGLAGEGFGGKSLFFIREGNDDNDSTEFLAPLTALLPGKLLLSLARTPTVANRATSANASVSARRPLVQAQTILKIWLKESLLIVSILSLAKTVRATVMGLRPSQSRVAWKAFQGLQFLNATLALPNTRNFLPKKASAASSKTNETGRRPGLEMNPEITPIPVN
jgi:hypothetical protein